MNRQPALLRALNDLKDVTEGDEQSLAAAFEACRSASDDVHYAHVLYAEIGELAIQHQQWQVAEEFAVRTLKRLPNSGKALKLLGKALKGQNRLDEAAICHRYGMPNSIRQQYFSASSLNTTHSKHAENVTSLQAYPAQSIPLAAPVSVNNNPVWELSQEHLHSAPAQTFRLTDARLWFDGFNAVVWDTDKRVVENVSRGFPDVVSSALGKRTAHQLTGKSCVLGNRNPNNYYHWMNDILPRIHVLQRSGIDINEIDHFIVNALQTDFQHETLDRLGINMSRLVIADHDHYFHCSELLVPTYGSNTLGKGQASWNPAFLKAAFLKPAQERTDTSIEPNRRLYISRKHAKGRSINNESELVTYLSTFDFHSVSLENLSVSEQAELFNSANIVIGAHGAGMSNIAFCESNTTVIELYKDHIAPCFWLISEMTGLRHAVHFCGENESTRFVAGDESYHDSADKRRLSDFRVDLNTLDSLFKKLQIAKRTEP